MSSSQSTSDVDYSDISKHVNVYGVTPSDRTRRDAAHYINSGYRVTDRHDVDLTIKIMPNGTRKIVCGEDPFGSFNERNRQQTLARAQNTSPSGRPRGLGERELTDYEAGREPPEHCGIANCDHPVHFGGSKTGELTFKNAEKDSDERRDSGK
ncbi:hypothetical protein LTR37_013298 [Vermiconidia calcicola]|uniref:Uncharacterized protein n=1 Tax=Vermiconidia calcicola TaxID=1690605 RepID=A0ACC3MWV5_9PEZI|nr:hypothetical protein LTR37_013298 [Vermiconidia calcicola]